MSNPEQVFGIAIGDFVRLTREHPWGPAWGKCIALEWITALEEYVPRLALESGREVLVTRREHVGQVKK
jgi:hypothetical protein